MAGPSKLNESKIQLRVPTSADLFFFANPATGLGGKNTIGSLAAILSSGGSAVTSFSTTADMLANTTLVNMRFALSLDTGGDGKWRLYLYLGGDRDLLSSYLMVARKGAAIMIDDSYDLSTDLAPSVGTLSDGGVEQGNQYYIAIAGSPFGFVIGAETIMQARVDNPATAADWKMF